MRRGQLLLVAACAGALSFPAGAVAATRPAPAVSIPSAAVDAPLGSFAQALVAVKPGAASRALLRAARAEPIAPALGIWRLPAERARELAPALRRAGALRYIEADRPQAGTNHLGLGDPLAVPDIGWHLYRVGADRVELAGPGVPITVVDSGLDTTHAEFRSRPNTVLLNEQPDQPWDTPLYHGTLVASVAAAPADGLGAVGVYPNALLHAYAINAVFSAPLTGDVVKGLHRAAVAGRTVINLSLSGPTYSRTEHEAVIAAARQGALVVAAAGNEQQHGSPLEYPASLPHVLTVGSTGPTDAPSTFSSASPAVDLAAPGEAIPVQHPSDPNVWKVVSGTSFATPIVAAAAAAVWTMRPDLDATQLADVLRASARDIGAPGFDNRTGFGLLDIPAALARPSSAADPSEPNDDIDQVAPGRMFTTGRPPVLTLGKRSARIDARLDAWEDPTDVYRVVVPARSALTATVTAGTNLGMTLWAPRTRSVLLRNAASIRNQLANSNRPGKRTERIVYRNRGRRPQTLYLDVWPARDATRRPNYAVTLTTR